MVNRESTLVFDSNFESGNLDMVYKVGELEYDLFMRVDTNTKGVQQWFYFSCEHGPELENKVIRFNVINFTKHNSLFSKGMRIVYAKQSQDYSPKKGGLDIKYIKSNVVRKKTVNGEKFHY